jgi:hypothetical protein
MTQLVHHHPLQLNPIFHEVGTVFVFQTIYEYIPFKSINPQYKPLLTHDKHTDTLALLFFDLHASPHNKSNIPLANLWSKPPLFQ